MSRQDRWVLGPSSVWTGTGTSVRASGVRTDIWNSVKILNQDREESVSGPGQDGRVPGWVTGSSSGGYLDDFSEIFLTKRGSLRVFGHFPICLLFIRSFVL